MKLHVILLILVMVSLLLFGCTASYADPSLKDFVMDGIVDEQALPADDQVTEAAYDFGSAEAGKSASGRVMAFSSALDNPLSVQIDCSQEQSFAKDNSLLFSTYIEMPVLSAQYFEDVENRVNSQIDKFLQKRQVSTESWENDAEAYYNEMPTEDALPFYGWSSNTTASVRRMDQNYISVVFFDSAYLGGAHPSNSQTALNFDAVTGSLLPLSAVLDGDTKDEVLRLLLSRLNDMEYTFGFYPDYKSSVSDIFNSLSVDQGQNWYLTDTSVVFFFSPEQISPYAAGVVTVELTYEELKYYLQSDFILPDHCEAGSPPVICNGSELPSDINIAADLSDGGKAQLAIYATDPVYDFRIYTGLVTENEQIVESTLYAANVLPAGSGVLVDIQKDTDSSALGVEYRIMEDTQIQWVN